jgi:hypothetical protein
VLYGFGRIGRLLARILIEKTGGGDGLRLRAIVVRKGAENDLVKRASLLRRDSVHGPFDGTITIDEANNTITANGNLIQVIYAKTRAKWTTPSTASRTRCWWTTPAYGVTPTAWASTWPARAPACPHRTWQGQAEEHRSRHQPRRHHRR